MTLFHLGNSDQWDFVNYIKSITTRITKDLKWFVSSEGSVVQKSVSSENSKAPKRAGWKGAYEPPERRTVHRYQE